MVDIKPASQLQLFVSCRKLADLDRFSVSDPRVELLVRDHGQHDYKRLGLSEVVWNNLNPDFSKAFLLDYYFEEQLRLKFNVFHVKDQSGDIGSATLIGSTECTLHEIVGSRGLQIIQTLRLPNSQKSRGDIILRVEEVQRGKDIARMRFRGKMLEDHGGFFHTFKPGYSISRVLENGDFQVIYKSDHLTGTNPDWPAVDIPIQLICNNDYHRPLRLEVYDSPPSSGKTDSLGTAETSLAEITEENKKLFPLINPEKQGKKGYQNSGALELTELEIIKKYDFLDYISGGCQMSLMVAIDFTSSNGNPRSQESLHHINPQGFNDYENALSSVGEILLSYDSDKLVPVYGFGGKLNGSVSHCFPLTFSQDPNVRKLGGILSIYRQALQVVELSGPTLFAQILQTAVLQAEAAQVSQQNQQYFVLLIITDGAIHDMQQTIDLVVRGSFAPLSIVIVGVGEDHFGNMNTLDADEVPLVDSKGKPMNRDIVQFVPFRSCGNNPALLTKEVLAEIPREIVNFFNKKEIYPNPPLPKPTYDSMQRANSIGTDLDSHRTLPTSAPKDMSQAPSIKSNTRGKNLIEEEREYRRTDSSSSIQKKNPSRSRSPNRASKTDD